MLRDIPADAWELKADHDSCWTSDGLDTPFHRLHWELSETGSTEERQSQFVRFALTPVEWVSGSLEQTSTTFPRKFNVSLQNTSSIDEWAIANEKRRSSQA
jgi:hypothetical protein